MSWPRATLPRSSASTRCVCGGSLRRQESLPEWHVLFDRQQHTPPHNTAQALDKAKIEVGLHLSIDSVERIGKAEVAIVGMQAELAELKSGKNVGANFARLFRREHGRILAANADIRAQLEVRCCVMMMVERMGVCQFLAAIARVEGEVKKDIEEIKAELRSGKNVGANLTALLRREHWRILAAADAFAKQLEVRCCVSMILISFTLAS